MRGISLKIKTNVNNNIWKFNLSPENSQLERFPGVRLKHESGDQMAIWCALWVSLVMASGIPMNFLSGPCSHRHKGPPLELQVIALKILSSDPDYFEDFINWSRFSLQGFENRAATVLQFLSWVWLLVTLLTATFQASQALLTFMISWSLLKLMSIESVKPSKYIILCHPLLLLPSILPIIKVFSSESALHIRWPKYWIFSFSIRPSSEYSRLISFRIDGFDLLAVQGTLKSLFQVQKHQFSSIQPSLTVQIAHPYMTTGKTTALTI